MGSSRLTRPSDSSIAMEPSNTKVQDQLNRAMEEQSTHFEPRSDAMKRLIWPLQDETTGLFMDDVDLLFFGFPLWLLSSLLSLLSSAARSPLDDLPPSSTLTLPRLSAGGSSPASSLARPPGGGVRPRDTVMSILSFLISSFKETLSCPWCWWGLLLASLSSLQSGWWSLWFRRSPVSRPGAESL
ncbi:hypothetical protein EYF80_031454 [Liparis tanakae]|uniref:Uncharacterized protein n=1 Tax=Liparis tanakae TaxID=230148 RepID=A0A4Z2H0C7_9TELE|nr:hypothetical protein EYF80_031454 [Liparis tanakae]